jgi:hypothetical protein
MTEHPKRLNAERISFEGGLFDGCAVDLVPTCEPSLMTVTPELPAYIRFGPDPGQMRPWTAENLALPELGTYDYQRVDATNRYVFLQENP